MPVIIQEMMIRCESPLNSIDAVAVSAGPGSYTGLRIGVTVARTMAWTWECPLLGISSLTALALHYETQPIPYWTSWWAHQLPDLVQRASTALTLAIELGAPWLYWGPRRARQVGAGATAPVSSRSK